MAYRVTKWLRLFCSAISYRTATKSAPPGERRVSDGARPLAAAPARPRTAAATTTTPNHPSTHRGGGGSGTGRRTAGQRVDFALLRDHSCTARRALSTDERWRPPLTHHRRRHHHTYAGTGAESEGRQSTASECSRRDPSARTLPPPWQLVKPEGARNCPTD